jgi:hypothetical protein
VCPFKDDTADHRNPMQWEFYVVLTSKFKQDQKHISLEPVHKLSPRLLIGELADAIEIKRREVLRE